MAVEFLRLSSTLCLAFFLVPVSALRLGVCLTGFPRAFQDEDISHLCRFYHNAVHKQQGVDGDSFFDLHVISPNGKRNIEDSSSKNRGGGCREDGLENRFPKLCAPWARKVKVQCFDDPDLGSIMASEKQQNLSDTSSVTLSRQQLRLNGIRKARNRLASATGSDTRVVSSNHYAAEYIRHHSHLLLPPEEAARLKNYWYLLESGTILINYIISSLKF